MNRHFTALALIVAGGCVLAQTKTGPSVDNVEKKAAVETLAATMKDDYVFPELGAKVERELKTQLRLGTYDKVTDGAELARILTEQMNAVCKDAHLRVRYSAAVLPARQDRSEPSATEVAEFKKRMKQANGGFQKVERLAGNIGYISMSNFMSPEAAGRPLKAAMDFVADTDALIVDMRQNGGGEPETVRNVCSYFFGEKPVHLNDLYFRKGNQTFEFWTSKKVAGKRYLDKPIYILASNRTGSGAEEFCYNLQNLKRAIIVGERTWGGANPGGMVRLSDHFSAFVPTGRAINPYTKTNWEGTGVKPDVDAPAAEALKTAHLLALRKLAEAAKDPADKERLEAAIAQVEGPVKSAAKD